MHVLLISTNTIREPYPILPIGLAYLSSALKEAGHQVGALDLAWVDDLEESVNNALSHSRPDAVGIYIRNTDDYNIDPPTLLLPMIRDLVGCLKEGGIDEERIIVGGVPVTNLKKALMQYIQVKFACIGEGEETFVKIIRRIERNESFKDIGGVAYLEGGNYFENERRFVDFNEVVPPDWDIYDEKHFSTPNKYGLKTSLSIQTKRGCPYHCIYCVAPGVEGNKLRLRDPVKVVDEMERAARRFPGISIDIIDNDFNMPREHGEAICREIIKRNPELKWTCAMYPKYTTRDFLELLKKANCVRIDLGADSGSPRMIGNLNRPAYTPQHLVDISQWCKEFGLEIYVACTLAGPGESEYTLRETFNILEKMELESKDGYPTVIFYCGLRIYPGTGLEQVARQEGWIWEGHPLLFPVYYFSAGMDQKAYHLIKKYREKHPEWLFKGTAFARWLKKYESYETGTAKPVTREEAKPGKIDFMNKKIPDHSLLTIDDNAVSLKSLYESNFLVFLVASQQSQQDARQWFPTFQALYRGRDDIKFQALGSIPPLPHFITKDFIKNQLKEVEKIVGQMLIDWESTLITGKMNLAIGKNVIILGIDRKGVLKFKFEIPFSEENVRSVCNEINAVLLEKE
jgi:radical SAM superfamily enzyme YgiQ (UPF0313 family)